MFHAAIDRIEEILGSPRKTNYKRFQRGSHWIGKICPMEEFEVSWHENHHYHFRSFFLLVLNQFKNILNLN
jgi:hypothetical protein